MNKQEELTDEEKSECLKKLSELTTEDWSEIVDKIIDDQKKWWQLMFGIKL